MMVSRLRQGFTLIELMIAVAIVAVLAAIAYPSYQQYVERTRRGDAIASLLSLAQAEERHMARCGEYASSITGAATCADAGLGRPATSEEGFYNLALTNIASGATYTLTATPTGAQASDDLCSQFSLTHLGQRAAQDADGGNTTEQCW